MKIIILLSAGILILAIILISWRFYRSVDNQNMEDKKEVTIKLKAVIENGSIRLKLSDSNGNSATDTLTTGVKKGGTITWRLKIFSKIVKIDKIFSTESGKVIFKNDARETSRNVFTLIVPDSVTIGMREKYIIKFIHNDSSIVEIDPYIRIEP